MWCVCSKQCINTESCDHISGACPSGCHDGFVGTNCNKCKMDKKAFISHIILNVCKQNIYKNVPTRRTGLKLVNVK